jgi:hypothetical protein
LTFTEKCENPLKPECEGTDIAVYIQAGNKRLPICKSCWVILAEQDVEWDEDGIRFKGELTSSTGQPSQKNINNVGGGVRDWT